MHVLERDVEVDEVFLLQDDLDDVADVVLGEVDGLEVEALSSEVEVEVETGENGLAVAALVAVAVLWGTNFPAVRYLVSDPVSLSPAAYAAARFGLSAVALGPLLPRASNRGALLAGAECGLWIAGGYVAQCLALQSTTAAKGALLAALQVAVVPAAVALVPALRPSGSKGGTSPKEWACAGAALVGVALLEAKGLTPPVPEDALAALQPLFFGVSYLRIAEAAKRYPSSDDALAMSAIAKMARIDDQQLRPLMRTAGGDPCFPTLGSDT